MSPVERVARIEKEISGVAAQYGVKKADQQFLRDLAERDQHWLSPKQEAWLADIEGRVFKESEGGEREADNG